MAMRMTSQRPLQIRYKDAAIDASRISFPRRNQNTGMTSLLQDRAIQWPLFQHGASRTHTLFAARGMPPIAWRPALDPIKSPTLWTVQRAAFLRLCQRIAGKWLHRRQLPGEKALDIQSSVRRPALSASCALEQRRIGK